MGFMTENVQAALLAIPMELAKIGDELQTGLQETHGGQRIDAARFVDVGRAPLLWGDRCRLVGWSLRPGAAPASVTLRNGRDDSAEIVACIDLADVAVTVGLPGAGVAVGEALWATVDGDVTGVVYLGVVD